jgi:hypothetical protein
MADSMTIFMDKTFGAVFLGMILSAMCISPNSFFDQLHGTDFTGHSLFGIS